MSTKAYTVLGWAVWQLAKRELGRNKGKVGAAATLLLVLIGGLAIAKATAGGDDS